MTGAGAPCLSVPSSGTRAGRPVASGTMSTWLPGPAWQPSWGPDEPA